MKKTQENILIYAIHFFNKKGVGNVRLQEIAKKVDISTGNLAYYYPQKKDLIEGVLAYMTTAWKENSSQNMAYIERNDYVATIQIRHRFFYRDI